MGSYTQINSCEKNSCRCHDNVHLSSKAKGFFTIHISWWKILPIKISEYPKKFWKFSNQLQVFKYHPTCRFNIHIRMLTINSKKKKIYDFWNIGQVLIDSINYLLNLKNAYKYIFCVYKKMLNYIMYFLYFLKLKYNFYCLRDFIVCTPHNNNGGATLTNVQGSLSSKFVR
jgi:hypothetical protein